jgi:clan AA aspartic protease (TIGR02281 family)
MASPSAGSKHNQTEPWEMKAAHLLATAALALMPASAHAYLLCSNPVKTAGAVGRNPVVVTYIGINDNHTWTVIHALANGKAIDRSLQYGINDASDRNHVRWWGRLNVAPHLWMTGEMMVRNATGGKVYVENIYDQNKGNAVVMHSEADCVSYSAGTVLPASFAEAVTASPSYIEPAAPTYSAPAPAVQPAPVALTQTSVAMVDGTAFNSHYVDALVGNLPVHALLDTGASAMIVTETMASALVSNGEAIWGPDQTSILADGSKQASKTLIIYRLTIGGRTIANVEAGTVPDVGTPLLGMSVLSRFGKFTIDTANSRLILG